MFHLWRAFRGTQYEIRDERLSVAQQDGLTVYRGWKCCWQYCFFKWSGSASELTSASNSCICEKKDMRALRRRGSPDLSRRQRPDPARFSTYGVDTSTDSSQSTTAQETSTSEYSPSTTMTPAEGVASTPSATDYTPATSSADATATSSGATASSVVNGNQNKGVKANHGGLSQGAKVGLGVGFGIAAMLLILLLAYLFSVRRRRKQNHIQMDPKYTPQAQSELSMVDPSYPVPTGPPRTEQAPNFNTTRHSQAYYEPPLPMQDTFETPVSAVTQKEAPAYSERHSLQQPLTLKIPSTEVGSVHSRDLSPLRGGSPVSPVSPVSAITPGGSRASTLK